MKASGYLLLILCLSAYRTPAQTSSFFFDQITVENGLSQSNASCILKDRRGYMWFGTQDGLNRYDGYQLITYKHYPFDSTSLPGDDIRTLCEDKQGFLWVGTDNGLSRFDPSSGKFRRFPELLEMGRRFSKFRIMSLTTDAYGTLWIAVNQGLFRLIPDGKNYRIVRYLVELKEADWQPSVNVLLRDGEQTIWVGTSKGLARLPVTDPAARPADTVEFLPLLKSDTAWQLPSRSVWSLNRDAFGTLWVGTRQGLFRFNAATGRPVPMPPEASRLDSTAITSLLIDRSRILWVGTDGNGIYRFRIVNVHPAQFLDTIQPDLFSRKGLKSATINQIYEGSDPAEDVVWIGTYDAGVHLFSRSKNSFTHWPLHSSHEQSSLSSMVFAAQTDRTGSVWFGTYDGLLRIDRLTRKSQRYRHRPGDPGSLAGNRINAIFEDRQGRLWVGTEMGLDLYNPRSNNFMHYKLGPNPSVHSGREGVLSIYQDRAGNLWIGCGVSLRRIDAQTGKETIYCYRAEQPGSMRAYMVASVREDRLGRIWVATWAGLYCLDPTTGRMIHYTNKPKDPTSLLSNQVMCLHIDRRGAVWVGTNKGLSQLTENGGRSWFIHTTEKEGLPNSMIYSLLEDRIGRIWMSSNFGLACLSPVTGQIRRYNANDGLLANEFNMGAYHQSAAGEFFFGAIGTVVSFHPEKLVENRHRPRMVLTSFRSYERPVNVDSLLEARGRVILTPSDNYFSLTFASLDYTNPQKNQYAYRLLGVHSDWIYSNNRRYISFTDLPPGDYDLQIKGSTSDGHWNEAGMLVLPITVQPPIWRTWWFYALGIALIGLIAKLIYNYRVRKRVRHLLELERVALTENERVRKLAAQDLHDEFGNTITRISMLTELIRARLNGHTDEIAPLLTKISDNSNRLYQGTKDFIWAINPEHDNFYEIAIRLKDFGDDIFDRTGIAFQALGLTDSLHEVVLPMGASRHLIFLFKEAMSNTLKHARATSGTLRFDRRPDQIAIQWEDNGVGMVIDSSYTGNGLLNIQDRARKIGGRVNFSTAPGQGTRIVFLMAVPQNAVPVTHL